MKAAPTVQPLLTFGQCLKNILGARKLSASALSRMMEQKSRNSMFRILDDTGGPAVQAAFFESLKASDCLHLTEQEERELERALEVSRFGVAGYMTNQAMHRLLGDVDLQAAADDSLRVDRSRDGSVTTLRESMERLAAEQKRVHFVITGCCYRRVLERIAAAFAGSACEMSIEHYLYTGGDEIIGCVSAIQPVLYLPDYKGYCIDENMFNIQREQVYRCNTITAHCEDAQGQKQVLMAVMIDPQRLLSIGSPDERNIEIVERMMREDRPKMHPIKREFQTSGSPEGYLAYTKSLQRLEQGRSIYDIKLDVPINFVAPEVLVGPARDGSPHNMRGIDITEWTAPLSQLALLGLHTIGVGDGGNEIGMGRVEDYAIEGVVDHGENIACTVPTDQLVVAGTSNWGAHALVCAMRALGSNAVDPYLEPTWQERVLDVIVEYGGLDGVHMTNVATVDGLEPDRYFKQVGQLTDCARS